MVNDAQDVAVLCLPVVVYEKTSSARVNWAKREALRLGSRCRVRSVLLPGGIGWQADGIK